MARWALRTGRDPLELPDAWHTAIFVGQVPGHQRRRLFGYRVGDVVIVVRYRGAHRHRGQQWEAISVWRWDHWQRWQQKTEKEAW